MAKARRRGKIFIDWSQNAAHKTTVAVYSLRASHDPPSVSVPVAWPELEQAIRKRRPESLEGLQIGRCPFANLPEPKNARRGLALTAEVMPSCRWLKPELVVQVEFAEWTPNGHLRHASFVGLREDKDPRLVVRGKAVPSEE